MSTVIEGKENIERFHWIALRGAIKLERVGMKRRGESARSIAIREFDLPKRTSYDELIEFLTKKIGAAA